MSLLYHFHYLSYRFQEKTKPLVKYGCKINLSIIKEGSNHANLTDDYLVLLDFILSFTDELSKHDTKENHSEVNSPFLTHKALPNTYLSAQIAGFWYWFQSIKITGLLALIPKHFLEAQLSHLIGGFDPGYSTTFLIVTDPWTIRPSLLSWVQWFQHSSLACFQFPN